VSRPECDARRPSASSGAWGARGIWKWLGGAVACLGLVLTPAVAQAGTCAKIDEQRDGLTPEERNSTRTLFEAVLADEKQQLTPDACTETWTLYHVRLGESITVVVQGPLGTRRESANKIEDLPSLYSQLVRSILSGSQLSNESNAVTRKNVTESQVQTQRVRADAFWYAKLGYGATSADGFHSGPEFGFGRRWELDRVGIDLAFFNFLMYQNSDEFDGLSAGWVELAADFFLDAVANSTPYIGAGLSLGSHSIPTSEGDYDGSGLQVKGTLGYEMFRASTIRMMLQFDAILPMYRLARKSDDAAGNQITSHVYCPNFMFSLGLGWGSSSE
jgi:hypothetical protein